MSEEILGVIAYLDSTEVDNLLASIEGGLVEQFVERYKQAKGKKGEGGIGVSGAKVGGGIESIQEEAGEAIKKTTPVSRLSALRKILVDNDYVRYVNAVSDELRQELIQGELVEIHGEVRTSAFGEFVDIAVDFLELGAQFSGLFGNAMQIDSEIEQGIRYLEYVTSKGVPVYITCPKHPEARQGFDFASILDPDALRVSQDNLRGTFNLLGRVRQVLERNEVVYLYDLIPGMSRMSRSQFKDLMKSFSKSSLPGFNLTMTEEDFRLRGPTVLVSPIAMYS